MVKKVAQIAQLSVDLRPTQALLIVAPFAGWMAGNGLRPEALALALLAWGFFCLLRESWPVNTVGFALLGAACFVHPLMVAFAGPLATGASLFAILDGHANAKAQVVARLAAAAVGVGLTFVLFLAAIDWRLTDFTSGFSLHASWRRVSLWDVPGHIARQLSTGYAMLLVVPSYVLLLFACAAGLWHRPTLKQLILPATFVGGVVLSVALYSNGFATSILYFAQVSLVTMVTRQGRWRYGLEMTSLGLVFTLAYCLPVVYALNVNLHTNAQEIRLEHHAGPFAIDGTTARFVHDFRLPPGTQAWDFEEAAGSHLPHVDDPRRQTTWIVARSSLATVAGSGVSAPRVQFFGRTFNSLPAEPFILEVVPLPAVGTTAHP